jgi:hypothetical protein
MWDEFKKIEEKTKKNSPSAFSGTRGRDPSSRHSSTQGSQAHRALGEGQSGGPYFQSRPVYSGQIKNSKSINSPTPRPAPPTLSGRRRRRPPLTSPPHSTASMQIRRHTPPPSRQTRPSRPPLTPGLHDGGQPPRRRAASATAGGLHLPP